MRAYSATADNNDKSISKLCQTFIGQEDPVSGELLEDQVCTYVSTMLILY
jgi:hypothetical protein